MFDGSTLKLQMQAPDGKDGSAIGLEGATLVLRSW